MDSKSQTGINFSHLVSGYDLMESARKQWMEAISQMFPDAAESGGKSNMPGMDAVKVWQQWYEDIYDKKKLHAPELRVMATACIDYQKRFSELQMAWWDCSVKAMQAVGDGMRNGDDPAQIMKDCMKLSEAYVRSCADFLAAQSEALSECATSVPLIPESGMEKAKPAKIKTL